MRIALPGLYSSEPLRDNIPVSYGGFEPEKVDNMFLALLDGLLEF